MKNYKKLQLPKDSAWDRKTWRRYTHWRIKYFIDGISNVFRWIPAIYHDRDWDDAFTLKMLQKKIENQRKHLVKENRHTQIDYDNYWMTVTLNLIERELECYYGIEMYDFLESNFEFVPVSESKDTFEIKSNITKNNLDKYLDKYPASIRSVMKKYKHKDFSDKETLAFHVCQYNQQKCRNLLFEILKQKSNQWWD